MDGEGKAQVLNGIHLEAFKAAWLVVSCAGLLVALLVVGEVAGDLKFVLRDVRTVSEEMWDARRIAARQTFGTMIVFLVVQMTIFAIRLWAVLGPRPYDPAFRSFWATDGSVMMVMNAFVALYQIWWVRARHEFIHVMDRLAEKNKAISFLAETHAFPAPPPLERDNTAAR